MEKTRFFYMAAITAALGMTLTIMSCKKNCNDDEDPTPLDGVNVGLVAHYKFNGDISDATGNGNNGINYGASFVSDRHGNSSKALSFNGNGNYALVPTSSTLTVDGDVSVCFWMRKGTNNLSSIGIPISKRNGSDQQQHFNVVIDSQRGISFQYSGEGAPSPYYDIMYPVNGVYGILNDGNWHFVVFTHTYGTRANDRLYIDDILYSVKYPNWHNSFSYSAFTDAPLTFGRQLSQDYYNGLLDDVRIYKKILTANEINTLYHE